MFLISRLIPSIPVAPSRPPDHSPTFTALDVGWGEWGVKNSVFIGQTILLSQISEAQQEVGKVKGVKLRCGVVMICHCDL